MKRVIVERRVISWEQILFEDIKVGDALKFSSGDKEHPLPGDENQVWIAAEEPTGSIVPGEYNYPMGVKADPEGRRESDARDLLLKWVEAPTDGIVPAHLVEQTMAWLKKE